MKSYIIMAILTVAAVSFFTACDKPDYQHPGYRSGKVK